MSVGQALGGSLSSEVLVVAIESAEMGIARLGGDGFHVVFGMLAHQSGSMLNALAVDVLCEGLV